LAGSGLGEHPKIGTLYLFLQLLKLATSNLIYNFGLRSTGRLPKTTCRTKFERGMGYGSTPKILGPLLILATVKSNDFTFGTQLGFAA